MSGFIGAAGVVSWSVFSRPADTVITHEVADSFNLQTVADAPRPSPIAAGEAMRDAVAAPPPASSLMRPIADSGLALAKDASPRPPVTAKAELWARKHPGFVALLAKPAAFLAAHSALRSVGDTRAFLADRKKVEAFMNSPLVRTALASHSIAAALIGDHALAAAVLGTPALRDPKTVDALLSSPMVRKMLDCPAVTAALADPSVMQRLSDDPKTMSWIEANPKAMLALTGAGR